MSSKFTKFRLMNHFIDGKDQAFYLTMNQINNNQELQVIAWNDDPANNQKASTEHTAHSKGVIIYDSLAENAIYIVHSIPKYPNFDKDGKVSIKIADSQLKYGQNILCMSLDIENLEKVISGLNIINSIIYHNTLKDQNFQNLKEFFQKNRRQIKNKAQTKTNEFKVNGISFWGFYKNPYYYGCIFENIMIPVLKSNMLVQSWGRPYQTPSCNQYECLNIKKIHIDGDLLGHWNSVEDHSKWSITVYGYFICSGDMNRMISQTKRGGAFFCFQDKGLWTALNSAIVDKERCRESKIDLILGPMFAGKTTQLIKRIKDYEKEKKTCLVLNHTLDSRYSSESFLISHNNDKIPAIKINKIEEIISNKLYEQFDVVGIDEGQFFSDISIGAEILANEGKIVIVSGLDGNYLRKPFADLINLIPMAECVIKLQAVCVKCNANASFTKRLKNERDEVLVGDQQIYIPLCRKCYFGYKVQ